MKPFMDENFLLQSETAQRLYHEHASRLPIIDYHCHLNPQQVAEDYRFRSITDLWLSGDHYKWRALRANGVPERLVTGDGSDWEKFQAWAETVPYCMRNPLYHWTHLELKTAFGIDKRLNPETAREIFDTCNDCLQNDPEMTARGLMRHYGVEVVCTTDDPVDDLRFHRAYAEEIGKNESSNRKSTLMLPAWRPDKAMAVENVQAWNQYVDRLAEVADVSIDTFPRMADALRRRQQYFHEVGCRLSDHGLGDFFSEPYTQAEIDAIFDQIRSGRELNQEQTAMFKTAMLELFCEMNHEMGWAQQFHYGPQRNNNSRLMQLAGPDTGFDSIGQGINSQAMARLFDRLDSKGKLAKSIVYNLNPADNEMVATMIGNFQDGSIPGKMQWGSGWWFMDQIKGMQEQMNTLSVLGLLSRFVGMLTDSRSFVSYTRHEYFRRVLCNLIGEDIERGEVPYDGYEKARVDQMVEDICYYNAKRYFNF